jgi:copper chaperone CopZ
MVAETPAPAGPEILTFYVTGMECGTCQAMITQSLNEVKGVKDVDLSIIGGYANVTFDPRLASVHQVAQAVLETQPVHGKPFVATLRIVMPDYVKPANKARVDAVLARHPEWVRIEAAGKDKGEFVVSFNDVEMDASKSGPQGWCLEEFLHAIRDPAPAGLGLVCEVKKEEPYSPVVKTGN